jgi:hypothetical protein
MKCSLPWPWDQRAGVVSGSDSLAVLILWLAKETGRRRDCLSRFGLVLNVVSFSTARKTWKTFFLAFAATPGEYFDS